MTKQIITLSDNAAQRIKEIMANTKDPSIGVRIGVKSGWLRGNVIYYGICKIF